MQCLIQNMIKENTYLKKNLSRKFLEINTEYFDWLRIFLAQKRSQAESVSDWLKSVVFLCLFEMHRWAD